jgi:iron complex outermembrane recepter protein
MFEISRVYSWVLGACIIVISSPAAADEPQDPEGSATAGTDLSEIIVTAQRREERLRDVPLSITVLNDEQLQSVGATNIQDLSELTPGLRIDRNAQATQPSMRGVSTSITTVGTDNPVAVYVDGVYQQSQQAGTFELGDIRRIEVLKGPQGTLFGRNATAGAIEIFTLSPEFTFNGKLAVSHGSFNDVNVNAFVTGPITDKLAFSLAGEIHNNDGYYHDIVNGKPTGGLDSHLFRGKLLFQPTDNLKVTLTGYISGREDGSAQGFPLNGNTVALKVPGAIVPTKIYDIAANLSGSDTRSYGTNLNAQWDLEMGTFTSISAYSRWETQNNTDGDFAWVPGNGQQYRSIVNEQGVQGVSQELNFSSRKFGALRFVTGMYFYAGYGEFDPIRVLNDIGSVSDISIYSRQSFRAGAVYGEGTYDLTDRLAIVAGLRYNRETRDLRGALVASLAPPPPEPLLGRRTDSSQTPRVSIKYKATEDTNLYFTFSKGFKSGTYNTTAVTPPIQSVAPEELTGYEVGAKSRLGPVDLSAAAYYYDYSNIQVSALSLINGVALTQIQNAASARVYGSDIESAVRFSENIKLSAGLSLLDAKYNSFPNASVLVPNADGLGNRTVVVDATGSYLPKAPTMTLNLTPIYNTELAGGNLNLSATVYYSAKYFFEPTNRIDQPSYTLIDARAAWSPSRKDNIIFSVYGRNLTNKRVISGVFIGPPGDGAYYAAPRNYGGSVSYKF